MKMRGRTKLWMMLVAVGMLVLIGDIVFKDMLTKTAEGVLSGIGSGLMGVGMAKFAIAPWNEPLFAITGFKSG